MYKESFIGTAGRGFSPLATTEAQINRLDNYMKLADPLRQINPLLQTPLTVNPNLFLDRLTYLVGENPAAAINESAAMYRDGPWQYSVEMHERMNPLNNARLYATDEGRDFNKCMAEGFYSRLVPVGLMTNADKHKDEAYKGLSGELLYHLTKTQNLYQE